jgi:hypothetical protein
MNDRAKILVRILSEWLKASRGIIQLIARKKFDRSI